jgi:hypothetical protein
MVSSIGLIALLFHRWLRRLGGLLLPILLPAPANPDKRRSGCSRSSFRCSRPGAQPAMTPTASIVERVRLTRRSSPGLGFASVSQPAAPSWQKQGIQ